ncbi:hypothetical protein F4802DRAFT_619102 [Xylaria palmicola]|nr:hypothetical protein F4802DRAFT_619102 [Xylaria palmicola]
MEKEGNSDTSVPYGVRSYWYMIGQVDLIIFRSNGGVVVLTLLHERGLQQHATMQSSAAGTLSSGGMARPDTQSSHQNTVVPRGMPGVISGNGDIAALDLVIDNRITQNLFVATMGLPGASGNGGMGALNPSGPIQDVWDFIRSPNSYRNGSIVVLNGQSHAQQAVYYQALPAALRTVLKEFLYFPRLPTELRDMVWEFALANERPRFVHLRAPACGFATGHRRRRCPKDNGRKLRIRSVTYEQVPLYFFVNKDCRKIAEKHYTIRFSVAQQYRAISRTIVSVTNIMMAPDDILVSWHTPELKWDTPLFDIRFGDGARHVHNLMIMPWRINGFHAPAIQVLQKLLDRLRNKDALKKVLVLSRSDHGALNYVYGIYPYDFRRKQRLRAYCSCAGLNLRVFLDSLITKLYVANTREY